MIEIVARTVATGVIATAIMDMASLALKYLRLFDSPDYRLVGRWIGHMVITRSFAHKSMARVQRIPFETGIGWATHYATGIVFAALLVAIAGPQWLAAPTLIPAVLTGFVTIALPLFVMQPAFGLGVAARLSSNPRKALLRSLLNHLSFGLGLYSAAAISAAL